MINDELIDAAAAVLHPYHVDDRIFGDVGSALVTDAGNLYSACASTPVPVRGSAPSTRRSPRWSPRANTGSRDRRGLARRRRALRPRALRPLPGVHPPDRPGQPRHRRGPGPAPYGAPPHPPTRNRMAVTRRLNATKGARERTVSPQPDLLALRKHRPHAIEVVTVLRAPFPRLEQQDDLRIQVADVVIRHPRDLIDRAGVIRQELVRPQPVAIRRSTADRAPTKYLRVRVPIADSPD